MDLVLDTSRPFVACSPKHALDRDELVDVARRRRGAVRVDVVDVLGAQLGVAQRVLHRALRALALGRGLAEVECVRGRAVADDLAVDLGAALERHLALLEHQDAGALGDHEAVAVAVERPARLLRLLVALRQRAHRVEAADAQRRDRRLGAARDRRVDVAALDPAQRLADGVRARRAGAGRRCSSGP